MSALSIQPSYPIFTDIDGQPLESGYVWVGAANLDPQTNPINVYWDASLTLLAPQPIRTLAGYPSNNGTPARLYVNSDYSIRVMNKNGSVVYSAPSATERYSDVVIGGLSASDIIYNQGDTGAINRTVEARLQDYVSVADFGADPTGVADSRQAIIDAINASTKIYFPPGTYTSSDAIVVRNKDVEIEGSNSSLTFTSGFFDIGGAIGDTYTLAANAAFGANVFTVTGGSFTTEDVMQLVDTTPFSGSLHRSYYHEGQLFTMYKVAGNVLTTNENALAPWSTGANITVKKISPVRVTIKDLHVFAPNTTQSAYACRIIHSKDIYLENSTFQGGDVAGITISNSKGGVVFGCKCVNTAPTTSGLQYGISIDDSEDIVVDACEIFGTRHGTGLGGAGNSGTKFIVIQNSTIAGDQTASSYVSDIHGDCAYITYQNNTIYGGAGVGGEYASYLNNVIYANNNTSFDPAFDFTEIVGGNFIIDGNQIYMPTTNNNGSVISSTSSAFWSKISYNYHVQITNNEISCNANNASIVLFGTHYLAPTVQPSITWENNQFRNVCSNISRIIHIASIIDPATSTYVAATGPFLIKDFTPHGTMASTVKVFSVSSGTIANGAKFFFPELNVYRSFNVISGTSTRTDAITFPFDYGSITPGVQATIANTTVQNGKYLFAGVDALTTTGCTGVVTTGNTASTLSADTVYSANFRIGGPKTY
jgi:hypothetical protein